jgi:hypothetical protein
MERGNTEGFGSEGRHIEMGSSRELSILETPVRA